MHHQFHTIETCKSRETIVIYSVQYTEANLIECGLLLYLLVLQFKYTIFHNNNKLHFEDWLIHPLLTVLQYSGKSLPKVITDQHTLYSVGSVLWSLFPAQGILSGLLYHPAQKAWPVCRTWHLVEVKFTSCFNFFLWCYRCLWCLSWDCGHTMFTTT